MTNQADDTAFRRQCTGDYVLAEITIAAHTAPDSRSFTNLLTVVELLHRGLEANPLTARSSKNGGFPRNVDLGPRAGRLHVHKFVLPVDAALSWYRGCLLGAMSVPGPYAPTVVRLPKFDEDPPWPHHVVETHDFWEGAPFWGERPGGSRWHRLIPISRVEITGGWNERDEAKAREWLIEQVHVDLLSRPVVVGSCHLRLPNPVYRKLATTRVVHSWSAIEVQLIPFPGADLSTLEFTHWNRRPWGATSVVRVPLRAGRTVVPLPEGVEEVAHAVTCTKRGLLEQSESAGFMSSVQVSIQIATEQRTVVVPRPSVPGGAETYSVPVASPTEPLIIGETTQRHALPRLAADESQRAATELWGSLHVQWFDGDATAGRQAIREIIRRAATNVDLLDPYFAMEDLLGFPLATSVHGLPVRILTSAEVCSKQGDSGEENGGALLNSLEAVRRRDPRISIEVRVMEGRKSPIHDRFLIADGTVWVLGSSLNEFGDRGSLLLRLPAAPERSRIGVAPVSIARDVFQEWWERGDERCPRLEEWVRRRIESRDRETILSRLARSKRIFGEAWRRIRGVWFA